MVKEFKEVVFETLYAEPSRNGLTKPRSVRGKGYKMINMGELFAYGRICNPPMDLVPLNENEIKNTQMQEGDLLFARQSLIASGAGKCSIVLKCPEITTFESHLIRVRLNKKISNPLFYYYYFSSPIGTEKTQSLVSQVAAAGIRGSELAKLNVHYIDLEYQDKIAKVLSNYDDLIENNNKRIKILEEMAQKIYKEWFVDFKFPNHETATFKQTELGEIPSDWEVVLVENLLKRLKAKNKYTQDNVISHGNTIVIDQSTAEFLGFHNNEPDFYANPEKPLIIFGDHTCKMQMLVENFSIGPNVIPITSENVPIAFLYYLIDSLIETKEYKRHWNDLIAKKVILPTNNLTMYYSKIITPIMATINHLKHKNMNLKQTRDLLLPRLISGEIDVENMEIV